MRMNCMRMESSVPGRAGPSIDPVTNKKMGPVTNEKKILAGEISLLNCHLNQTEYGPIGLSRCYVTAP